MRVIKASKESTINSLRDLGPVLEGFAEAGQNFPKSFQVFLTYPFVDEAIGRDPQVARNLHMGDYTNLSVNLDLDVANLPKLPGLPARSCDTAGRRCRQTRRRGRRRPCRRAQTFPTPADHARTNRDDLREEIAERLVAEFRWTSASSPCRPTSVACTPSPRAADRCCSGGPATSCGLVRRSSTARCAGGGTRRLRRAPAAACRAASSPARSSAPGFQEPQPIDPFGLARHGLDPGIGTMLLQGVATNR